MPAVAERRESDGRPLQRLRVAFRPDFLKEQRTTARGPRPLQPSRRKAGPVGATEFAPGQPRWEARRPLRARRISHAVPGPGRRRPSLARRRVARSLSRPSRRFEDTGSRHPWHHPSCWDLLGPARGFPRDSSAGGCKAARSLWLRVLVSRPPVWWPERQRRFRRAGHTLWADDAGRQSLPVERDAVFSGC